MWQRIRVFCLTCAVSLFLAAGAYAANVAVKGTVATYDPVTGMITFTDGRVARVEPGSRILIDGRQAALTEVAPGAVVVLLPAAAGQAEVVQPQPAPSSIPYSGTAGGVKGTVQYVDPVAKVITFRDGTIVQLEPDSRIFIDGREVALSEVRPGATIVMSSAPPASGAVVAAPSAPAVVAPLPRATAVPSVRGTLAAVDPQIVLSDGTVVAVDPSTQVQIAGGKAVAIRDLRPGDQVVVEPRHRAGVAGMTGARASIDAAQIVIIRKAEAP
jgi:hypothetical protein